MPQDTELMLATTTGEIDLLQKAVLAGEDVSDADPRVLLARIRAGCKGLGAGSIISAACASATTAMARAGARIRSGKTSSVLIVAVDSVTEFVFSGFSSLRALDPLPARPFDRTRKGLNVGEAAAVALLMSEERALIEGREPIATLRGWGLTNDANHMTGPSRDGGALARAIEAAAQMAGTGTDELGAVCAHGTGTPYNDGMEMKAFRTVRRGKPFPVFSVKGGTGHCMGAAGLVETLVAIRALQEQTAPPTPGLSEPDDDALGWAAPHSQPLTADGHILTTNSGFGGINAALVLSLPHPPTPLMGERP